jgi:hypothetical protein
MRLKTTYTHLRIAYKNMLVRHGLGGLNIPNLHHFATLVAANAAAAQLLDAVHREYRPDSSAPQPFVLGDRIGYQLLLETDGSVVSWVLGTEPHLRPPTDPFVENYLPLCPQGDGGLTARLARKDIDPMHARFYLHPRSGVLMLEGLSDKVTYYASPHPDGERTAISADCTAGRGRKRASAMYQRRNILQIGEYKFELTYAHVTSPQFWPVKKELHAAALAAMGGGVSRHLDLIPAQLAPIAGFAVHKTLQLDGYRSAHAGVDIDSGDPRLLTVLARQNYKTDQYARDELRNGYAFPADLSHGTLGIIDSACSHGCSPSCLAANASTPWVPEEEVYYTTALPETRWDQVDFSQVPPEQLLSWFAQTLRNLATLHGMGRTHGHIQPSSILLVSEAMLSSPAAPPATSPSTALRPVFGGLESIRQTHKRCDMPPPPLGPWVAPEVFASTPKQPYGFEADVFSLAVCWLRAFANLEEAGVEVMDADGHAALRAAVLDAAPRMPNEGLCGLLIDMTEWIPAMRPTADRALGNVIWDGLGGSGQAVGARDDEHEGASV